MNQVIWIGGLTFMSFFTAATLYGLACDLRRAWPSLVELFTERQRLDDATRRYGEILKGDTDDLD